MIQPAAPPVSASSIPATGSQAAHGDDAAVSGGFAALLQSNRAAAPDRTDKPRNDKPVADSANALQRRQVAGNVTGKKLPSDLPDADDAADDDAPSDADSDSDAPATGVTAMPIMMPSPILPVVAATPAPAPASSPQAAAAANGSAGTVAAAAAAAAGAQAVAALVDKAKSGIANPALAPAADQQVANGANTAASQQPTADQNAAAPQITAAALALKGPTDARSAHSAAKAGAGSQASAAALQPASSVDSPCDSPAHAAKSATDDAAPSPPQAAIGADLQPAFALGDAQAFARTAVTTTAGKATNSPDVGGHDFATLVDRLVEARDAAMPQSVNAAVSHSEFGRVSLRFEHDANGLSVAMSSADPDFARTVQASAASAQPQTTADNGSAAPRQDGSMQQQAGGSPSGQPQAHARSERGTPASNQGAARPQLTQDDDAADTRSGIYA